LASRYDDISNNIITKLEAGVVPWVHPPDRDLAHLAEIVQQAYFSAILSPIESSSASMIFKPVSVILTTSVTHDSNFVF
jgi:hypothetical protein